MKGACWRPWVPLALRTASAGTWFKILNNKILLLYTVLRQ